MSFTTGLDVGILSTACQLGLLLEFLLKNKKKTLLNFYYYHKLAPSCPLYVFVLLQHFNNVFKIECY